MRRRDGDSTYLCFLRLYNAVAEALHSRFLRLCGAVVAKVDFARNIFLISEVREDQS